MHHHVNHCWCSKATHNNDFYDCQNIVGMTKYEEADKEDWENLIVYEKVLDAEDKRIRDAYRKDHPEAFKLPAISEEEYDAMMAKDCPTFQPEVFEWLEANIKPQCGEPGWAIGSEQYRVTNTQQIDLFFKRRIDAKKFIKEFSVYKKRTSYYNHFDDTNQVLDLKTNKYKNRHGGEA